MKLKNLENLFATNESLRNRQYSILGLTAEDIPIRIRPEIQNFLENVIIKTRNFIPGDLEYTIRLFNSYWPYNRKLLLLKTFYRMHMNRWMNG